MIIEWFQSLEFQTQVYIGFFTFWVLAIWWSK